MQPTVTRHLVLASAMAFGICGNLAAQAPKPAATPSVAVFPVLLADKPSTEVANVVGILLERGGLQRVELDEATFAPDHEQEFAAQASAFAAFVKQRGLKTDYALFADILGAPKEGIAEVRGVMVDGKGTVVWSECLKAGVAAFDRDKPKEPMDCCVLLVQQLRQPLHLADPLREGAPEGRLARRMKDKAGVPPQAEFEAMRQRLAALKQLGAKASIVVYPVRVGSEWSTAGATELAARLQQGGLVQAAAVAEAMRFQVENSSNEQAVLWSGARSIQKAVRAAGAATDYLLFCDFRMQGDGKAGAVHTYLLSPAGEFVVVDYQNSHHEDFQKLKPASTAACGELAALRLAGYLRP